MNKAELENAIRNDILSAISELLTKKFDTDVLPTSASELAIPVLDAEGNAVTSTSTIVNGKAYVYFDGLADGTYWVSETTVPSGFNAVADFSFTVNETVATQDNPATTDITEKNFLVEEEPVPDPEGVQLPSTGGIGTTIFYTIGAILVIGAGVILVTRRRMNVQ